MIRWLFILALLAPAPAFAWGAQGHEIISEIALRQMSPKARAQVARLLGSETMLIHDASWADEIRDQRPEASRWHYVDIPLGARSYDARRDCRDGDCVVAQIERDRRILADRRARPAVRAEALRFLMHFIADVHQPLHAEDNDDRGGNAVRVTLGRQRTNLHHVWDVDVVQTLGYDARDVAASITVSPAQRKAWCNGNAADWANESHALARDIYEGTRGHRNLRLSPTTLHSVAPITRQQLAKAGTRLACTLNQVLG